MVVIREGPFFQLSARMYRRNCEAFGGSPRLGMMPNDLEVYPVMLMSVQTWSSMLDTTWYILGPVIHLSPMACLPTNAFNLDSIL